MNQLFDENKHTFHFSTAKAKTLKQEQHYISKALTFLGSGNILA